MSETEIMRNQPLSCTALQQSNHPRVNSNMALNSKTRVDATPAKAARRRARTPKVPRLRDKNTNSLPRISHEVLSECDASSRRFWENSNFSGALLFIITASVMDCPILSDGA